MVGYYLSEGLAVLLGQVVKPGLNKKGGHNYLDLHVHLSEPGRDSRALGDLFSTIEEKVDGFAVVSYGPWIKSAKFEDYSDCLYLYSPDKYVFESKEVVGVLTNKENERKILLFKAQEMDRTLQRVDITGIGIRDYTYYDINPNNPKTFPDARAVIEKIHSLGGIAILEHFCARETAIMDKAKSGFGLPWIVETYEDKNLREQLYELFQMVDAVEVFNGLCTLYMIKQNVYSKRIVEEFEREKGKKLVKVAGSDTHFDQLNIGSSGVFVEPLDLKLEGKELIEQLRNNLKNAILLEGYPTFTSFAVQMSQKIRGSNGVFASAIKSLNKLHDRFRLDI